MRMQRSIGQISALRHTIRHPRRIAAIAKAILRWDRELMRAQALRRIDHTSADRLVITDARASKIGAR